MNRILLMDALNHAINQLESARQLLSEGKAKAAGYRLVEGVTVASHAKKLAAQLGIVECGDRS